MFATSFLAGCTATPYSATPYSATPGAADTLNAGLEKVSKPVGMDEVWVKPGFDPNAYSKIMRSDLTFEFRSVRRTGATSMSFSSGPYKIEQNDRDKLQQVVSDAVAEEFKKIARYQSSVMPGPQTIKLEIQLQDVVSNVPPQGISRSDIYLAEVGRATLVMELKDSISGDTLMRAIDRRTAENYGATDLKRSSSIDNWGLAKRLARTWARSLRQQIDEMKNVASAVN